ncbi:MAG: LysR family transcriptional regulator [Aquificae bacterium]|nr:LysR family transcriptional regulator [Aquificota bacterium]
MQIQYKVWLEKDGEPILSLGKYLLLKEIEKTGSIKRAAENLNLPYKKAHSYVKLIEQRLGKPIFQRHRGKGTSLTKEGKKLLETYGRILEKFEALKRELEKELSI